MTDPDHDPLPPPPELLSAPEILLPPPPELLLVPPPAPRPRIWTVFVVPAAIVPVTFVSSIVALLALQLRRGRWTFDQAELERILAEPGPFLVMLLASQLVLGGAAFLAAILSPVPFRERLGLVRARVGLWAYPVLAVGSLLFAILGGILWSLLFRQESEHLESFVRTFREAGPTWGIVLLVAASVLPGLFEESLFRGYVQRRLLQRWPPILAVGFASAAFAAIHLDPQHMVRVVPIALWLGYVAWRSGSTWPCVLCHLTFNVAGLAPTVLGVLPEGESDLTAAAPYLALGMLVLLAATAGSIVILELAASRARREASRRA